MANPLYDKLNGNQQPINPIGNYESVIARANQLAHNLPQNFNPQMIVQNMLNNGQVTQQQLDQAMQLANRLTGRRF